MLEVLVTQPHCIYARQLYGRHRECYNNHVKVAIKNMFKPLSCDTYNWHTYICKQDLAENTLAYFDHPQLVYFIIT